MRLWTSLLLLVLAFSLLACGTDNEDDLFGIDDNPPVITVAGVQAAGVLAGVVNIAATATDFFGIAAFSLAIDSVAVQNEADGSLTYAWNTLLATNGAHTLLFTATDENGNVETLTLNVTVANGGGGDGTLPVINITGVANGGVVAGTVNIHATATDNIAVTSFTLKRDGVLVATGVAGVIDYALVTTALTDGAHVLLFEATDATGNLAATTYNITVNNGGGGGTGTVTGVVLAQNGVDPVPGALIYIPLDGNATGSENETDDGTAPDDPYSAFAYSLADGSFTLANVPLGAQLLIIIKGAFKKYVNLNVVAGANALPAANTTLPANGTGGGSVPKMAVVTGDFDHIQNLLAKMGLGTLDVNGELVLGSQQFTLVDGNSSLENSTAYPNFDIFISDTVTLATYDIIFLNCGNDFDSWFFATPSAIAALKNWVEAGGRLYCSDWSYSFVEQLWPDRIDFYGGADGLSTTPETMYAALMGGNMDSLNATVADTSLRAWLGSTAINALNLDQSVTISDWLISWAAMTQASAACKTWVEATLAVGAEAAAVRPLTVSFTAGQGMVLFSSYHTEETPAAVFTKNDRILEYLLLEVMY